MRVLGLQFAILEILKRSIHIKFGHVLLFHSNVVHNSEHPKVDEKGLTYDQLHFYFTNKFSTSS